MILNIPVTVDDTSSSSTAAAAAAAAGIAGDSTLSIYIHTHTYQTTNTYVNDHTYRGSNDPTFVLG
jgi:hypothetical protein